MRLFDFSLSEAISATTLRNSLKKEIKSEILDSVHQIGYKEPQLDPEIKEEANKNVSLSKPMEFVEKWLKEQLDVRVSQGISNIIKAHTGIDCRVRFEDMKTGGYASGTDMAINNNHLSDLAKEISESMYQVTLDNVEEEHKIVETMFRSFKTVDNYGLYYKSSLDSEINKLISIVVHELVHVMQHSAQSRQGRGRTEYRSYLEPNKEKFHSIISKMHRGEETTPEEDKIYRASPQEIPAFAQQEALKFIENADLDDMDVRHFPEYKKELPQELRWYVNNKFHNPDNYKEYAVFKRFHKIMYQEIMRYIEQTEHRLLKQQRRDNAG